MNVTRDVIIDLLALCHAGEASEDTRKLVETYAESDPTIQRLLAAPPIQELPTAPNALDKETEMHTLEKAKTYVLQQTILLASASFMSFLAVAFLAVVPAFFFLNGAHNQRQLILAGVGGLFVVLLAAAAWTSYFIFRHVYRVNPR